jgi:hypothetical protein
MITLIITLFLPIYLFIAFRNPRKAFVIWVLISPFTTLPLFKLGIVPAIFFDRIAIGAIILSMILGGNYSRVISLKLNKLENWMLIFICVLGIGLLFTYRPKDAIVNFLTILDDFGIPFMAYYCAKVLLIKEGISNEKLFNQLVNVSIIIGLSLAIMGIYEGITLIDLMPAPESRYSMVHGGTLRVVDGLARVNGPYFTPETFGVVLSMLFFIVLYRVNMLNKVVEKNKKVVCLVVLGTILGGVYFNMFRSIWLGLVLGLACRFLLMPKKRFKMIFVSLFVIMIIAIAWADITSDNVYKNRVSQAGTFYNRVGAWLFCLRAFSENPLFGIGYGGIYKYIEHAQEEGDIIYVEGEMASEEPHQTFLKLLAENGILGLIPFLFLFWCISRYMREYYLCANNHDDVELSVTFISIFVAYFVPMFFDISGYYNKINNVFYVFVGIAIAKVKGLQYGREGS